MGIRRLQSAGTLNAVRINHFQRFPEMRDAAEELAPGRGKAGRMAPMTTDAPLVLLDGASMWFRSYFGVPSSITSPDGRPVNALRGFLDAVATVITRERPGRLVVCRDDDWRPQWRGGFIPPPQAPRGAGEGATGPPRSGKG